MSSYPQIVVHSDKLHANIHSVKQLLDRHGVEAVAVTKAVCSEPLIVGMFVEAGIKTIADARLENLQKLRHFPVRKMLLRLPALSELEAVLDVADVSLVSHLETARQLSKLALTKKVRHGVILMADLGDLREGIYDARYFVDVAKQISQLPNIDFEGIGANFSCFGPVIPTMSEIGRLHCLVKKCRLEGIEIQKVSAGNSSGLHLLDDMGAALDATQLRIGEAFLLGAETAFGEKLEGAYQDCFTLCAEIIEKYHKPSMPAGLLGRDGFGKTPVHVDRGTHWRAICAVGKQDVDLDQLTPINPSISIVGGSSDHLIIDLERCPINYELGDIVEFRLGYAGILRAMTSPYVSLCFSPPLSGQKATSQSSSMPESPINIGEIASCS